MKREKYPDWYWDTKPIEHRNVRVGRENREKVMAYLKYHPNTSIKVCAFNLGLAESTVGRHIRSINADKNGV